MLAPWLPDLVSISPLTPVIVDRMENAEAINAALWCIR
jgi:hypothetical protein